MYETLPDPKPPFDEVWKWTGGNPRFLERLFETRWDVEQLVERLVISKSLYDVVSGLDSVKLEVLKEAVEDPDVIFRRIGEREVQELRDMATTSSLSSTPLTTVSPSARAPARRSRWEMGLEGGALKVPEKTPGSTQSILQSPRRAPPLPRGLSPEPTCPV